MLVPRNDSKRNIIDIIFYLSGWNAKYYLTTLAYNKSSLYLI